MNPVRIPVRRPVATAMFFLALALMGWAGWQRIPVELMPPFSGDQLFVSFARAGSDPEVVEREMLLPLAARAARLEGVEETFGQVSGSSGTLRVKLASGTDPKVRELELRRAASEIAREQPPGSFVEVGSADFSAFSKIALVVQVTGGGARGPLYDFVDEEIRPRLAAVSGVSQVLPTGGAGREITVRLDVDRSAMLGVDPGAVASALANSVRRVRFLGGIEDGDERIAVVLDGRPKGVESIGRIRVDPSRPVELRHVATVEYGSGEDETLYRLNGGSAVGLAVFKEEAANLVQLGHDLRARMDAIEREFAARGLEFRSTFDAAEVVEEQLDRLRTLALTGFAIALIVLYVFLREWRAVAVVAVAVPVSLLVALALLYLIGMSLNLVTLFGLAVGIGMLVDNSIVVYEAVQRQLERGARPAEAAESGVVRTVRAVAAASATNAIVFLPIVFTAFENPTIRILVRVLAVAIVIPIVASLLVAVGLVPLLAHRLAAPAAERRIEDDRRRRERSAGRAAPDTARELFAAVMKNALRRPGPWFGGTAVAVFLTIAIAFPIIGFGLSSQESGESDVIVFEVDLPGGGSLDRASDTFAAIEAAALDIEGVDTVESIIREDGGRMTVNLLDAEERPEETTAASVRERLREEAGRFPRGEVDLRAPTASSGGLGGQADSRGGSGNPFGEDPEEIVLSGPDAERLVRVAREIEDRIESIDAVGQAWVSVREGREEMHVLPRESPLAAFGLTSDQLLPILRTVRREGVDLRVGFTTPDGREIPLVVRRVESDRGAGDTLRELRVPLGRTAVPLGALADVRAMPPETAIQHHDGRREISVFYRYNAQAPQTGPARAALEAEVREAVRSAHRPAGYTVEVPDPAEGFDWFKSLLVPVVLLLFALLAITFESMTLPVLVLIALPLTVLGASWALVLSGTPAGPMALAGVLALVGVTVNPAILLVDRMQQRMRAGAVSAGAAALASVRERTRPVLMTAATTLAGLWPLALSTGRENELWPPFATVMMGGLLTSAALTLVVIPLGFVVLRRLDGLFGRLGPWVVIVWSIAVAATVTPMFRSGLVGSTTWRIVTTVLVAAAYLALAARVFRKERRVEPQEGDGPPVFEARFLSKVYGRPGPIGRALRAHDRFVDAVLALGGSPFDRVEAARRVAPWVLGAAGVGYLASTVRSGFWAVVFALVAAVLVVSALRELRRARGRVDARGRVLPGGVEGAVARVVPWIAVGWIAFDVIGIRGRDVGVGRGIVLGLVVLVVAVAQLGRATAVDMSLGRVVELRAGVPWRRVRRAWRRFARPVFGLDLPAEEVHALEHVHLKFEGGMVGILGPNGAGKTTFLRTLAGILEPTTGTVWLGGTRLERLKRYLARWIGYLPQDFGLPADLTARQYLDYFALLYEIPRAERGDRVARLLEEVGLAERADEKIGGYSGGMRQRVAVARTLLRLPPVIIVDEPTVGLDPRERIRFRNLLSRLARGRVVLFSTHVVEDVAVACERVVVLARGRLVFDGAPGDLARYAEGRVWSIVLADDRVHEIAADARLVDQVPEPGGTIRSRVLAASRPHPDAESLPPTLEDGYFVLAGDRGGAS